MSDTLTVPGREGSLSGTVIREASCANRIVEIPNIAMLSLIVFPDLE
jgi:hypothetical protein